MALPKRNRNTITEGELAAALWVTIIDSREKEDPPTYHESGQRNMFPVALLENMSGRSSRRHDGLPPLLSMIETEDLLGIPFRIEAVRLPFVVCSSVRPFSERTDYRYVMDTRRYILQELSQEYIQAFKPPEPEHVTINLGDIVRGNIQDRPTGSALLDKLRPSPKKEEKPEAPKDPPKSA